MAPPRSVASSHSGVEVFTSSVVAVAPLMMIEWLWLRRHGVVTLWMILVIVVDDYEDGVANDDD